MPCRQAESKCQIPGELVRQGAGPGLPRLLTDGVDVSRRQGESYLGFSGTRTVTA